MSAPKRTDPTRPDVQPESALDPERPFELPKQEPDEDLDPETDFPSPED